MPKLVGTRHKWALLRAGESNTYDVYPGMTDGCTCQLGVKYDGNRTIKRYRKSPSDEWTTKHPGSCKP